MKINFEIEDHLFEQYFTTTLVNEEVLTLSEKTIIEKYSDKRLAHFCTGRYCAKQALSNLTASTFDILMGPDGEPKWPEGYVGSISHGDELIGALAAKKENVISLGLDIEKIGRVKPEMWHLLFTEKEKIFLNSLNNEDQPFYTTLYFSMKESFYKLQHELTKHRLWFHDVEILYANNEFKMEVLKEFEGKDKLPNLTALYYEKHDNHIVSLCYLKQTTK